MNGISGVGKAISRRGFLKGIALAGAGLTAGGPSLANTSHSLSEAETPVDKYTSRTGTGGELMVAQLNASGAEYVFANPGSTEAGFFDALHGATSPRLIMGLHEGIVTSMAHGYQQVSGRPGIINVHAIVGTAQMGGQLYNAHRDGASLVVTAGMVDHEVWCDDIALAARPGYSQTDLNRQFTKMAWSIREPESIPMALRRAIKVSTSEPAGPVYLALADYALAASDVRADIIDQQYYDIPSHSRPDAAQIDHLARWLIEAEFPMLVVGPELERDGAVEEAVALSELLGIGVTDLAGHIGRASGFPTTHPLFFHRLALHRRRKAPCAGADLFIGLGPSHFFPEGTRNGMGLSLPKGAKYVTVGLDADAMGRTRPHDMAIRANIKSTLQDLIAAVNSLAVPARLAKIRTSRYMAIAADTDKFRRAVSNRIRSRYGQTPVHPDEAALRIESYLDQDAVTVHENFSHDAFGLYGNVQRYGLGDKKRVASNGFSLGWGVGAATGASLAAPDRQVVLHIGDGAAMFSAAGFWSMARYQTPVLTIVWNNRQYQTVRMNFEKYGGEMAGQSQYPATDIGDPAIDFVQLAQSQGITGETVETAQGLDSAMKRGIAATKSGTPYLIDMRVGRLEKNK